ncbi:hypothetical protein [Burkholderia pseudomallei]|uniref:hypothetical protein n=1 Tax=Burkholderia pseudomallei TaxID=28450 RepID=UPI000F04EFC3|nr:hypothetical protein [Burkholderia pseudomallei]
MDDGEAEDGELANWRTGELANWRTGELANWRIGGPADRRTGDIGSDIASARPALALTRAKR